MVDSIGGLNETRLAPGKSAEMDMSTSKTNEYRGYFVAEIKTCEELTLISIHLLSIKQYN